VCIIGGGYTGLSAALHLRQAGYDVVLLEAKRVGFGASGRNGGQLYGGMRRDVDWLEDKVGRATAKTLWQLGDEARQLVKDLIHEHRIDCDLTPGIAIVAHRRRYVVEYHELVDKLTNTYGATDLEKTDAARVRELIGTDVYYGGYVDWAAAHLHPLNLARGIARAGLSVGVRIHEDSTATGFAEGQRIRIETSSGYVEADHLLIATNGYLGNLSPKLAGRIMPINNFIIATEPMDPARVAALNPQRVAAGDSRFVINYFRIAADGRLLFGGGENYRRGFPRDIAGFVRPYMLKIYPQLADLTIDYAWGGTLAITMNRMPHFGRLSPRIYFAHGYSGQGVAMAHLAGKLFVEAIRGSAERFDVFSRVPTPRFPGGRLLRWPGLVLGMTYFALRDRL
jgi:gamma-glutamylputrescine oxidase